MYTKHTPTNGKKCLMDDSKLLSDIVHVRSKRPVYQVREIQDWIQAVWRGYLGQPCDGAALFMVNETDYPEVRAIENNHIGFS